MPIESVTQAALQSALDGLSLRQKTIAANISNVNTPGYQAKRVQFEEALGRSVAQGGAAQGAGHVQATTQRSLEPTRLDGNNVNLDTETLSNIDTVLRYQFATQAMNGELTSVRAAYRTN